MNHKNKTRFAISITLALLLTLLTACAPSSERPLEREDYNIYLNGKKAIDIDEVESFTISEDSEEAYETMRGIKLGDTTKDVARAYRNIPSHIYSFDNNESTTAPDLGKYLKEHSDFTYGYFTFRIAIIDGVLERDADEIDAAMEKHPQHEIKTYSLLIGCRNGKAEQIQCWTGTFEVPRQNTDST